MFWDRQKVSFHPTSTGHSNLVLLCCLSCISQPPMVRRFAPRDEIGATNKEGEELSHHGSFDSRAFRMQRRIAQRLHWRSGYITNIGRATDDRCHMFGICFTIYFYHASVVALWSTLILGMYFANQIKMLLDVYTRSFFLTVLSLWIFKHAGKWSQRP